MTDNGSAVIEWPDIIKDVPGVWGHDQLLAWAEAGGLDQFDDHMMQPASVDLRLGDLVRRQNPAWEKLTEVIAGISDHDERVGYFLNFHSMETQWLLPESFDKFLLMPGESVLFHSRESVQVPSFASSFITLKSSIGRSAVSITHTGWGECGFGLGNPSQWTFCLTNIGNMPRLFNANMRVIQMIMIGMPGDAAFTYATRAGFGSYQGQKGPTVSRTGEIDYTIETGAGHKGQSSKSKTDKIIQSATRN